MAKILLINPNRWGRGITHIWIASHSGILKKNNHEVELFDATFYKNWSLNEIKFQTNNKMYQPTKYEELVNFNLNNVFHDLQKKINQFNPDVIFWSAISSHIHAEGEYANIQNGYELIKNLNTNNSLKITAGLQATSATEIILKKMPLINYLILGESEQALLEILNNIDKSINIKNINGLAYLENNKLIKNLKQNRLQDLNQISPYDYNIFNEEVFYRPYNGRIVKAVDYEMSRGCIYSCNYCVETIIQKYYGFESFSKNTGVIDKFKSYLRHKSARVIFSELTNLNKNQNINFVRCQDTNFLTIDRKTLLELAELLENSSLDFKLYIETRPEGINEKTIDMLKKLKVDGVGMGVELADVNFREDKLNRFANQEKTIKAFNFLKKNGIKRTAYNIIGLPNQDEKSILETINFNKILDPDNITVAFYSPYYGTKQQIEGRELGIFDDYEFDVDSALRSKSKDRFLSKQKLQYYKEKFVDLVRNANSKN